MTRKEQIVKAFRDAEKQLGLPIGASCYGIGYLDGALWADEHPTEEVQRLKEMFKGDPDAYEQGYKDAVDKASKWLIDNLPLYFGQINADNTDRFVRIFRKAMEEQ